MTWLNKLKSHLSHESPQPPSGIIDPEVVDIVANAKVALTQAQERHVETQKVSGSLAEIRIRNHFGEQFQRSMMPKGHH